MPARTPDGGASAFESNPYLDALPPTLNASDVAGKLMFKPFDPEAVRRMDTGDRRVMIEDLDDLFCARNEHIRIYNAMNSMMRASYKARNPLCPAYVRSIYGIEVAAPMKHKNGSSVVLTGVTGAGKTKAINAIAGFYPQCIDHGARDGALQLLQFPILVVRCGGDPSPKGLCRQVFYRIKEILGEEPMIRLPGDRNSVQELTQAMYRLCTLYGVGLIVWDEFQDLVRKTRLGDREICNLLLATRDTLSVPMMMVGTFPILEALQNQDTRVARRSAANDLLLSRFLSPIDKAWENMCSMYLNHQVLRDPAPTTPQMIRHFYELSQGVPGFFISLFKATQSLALDLGRENFDRELMDLAFNTRCMSLHRPVAALASNDPATLKAYPDIWSPLLREEGTDLLKKAMLHAEGRRKK